MNPTEKVQQSYSYTLGAALFCLSLLIICYIFLRVTWAIFMTPLWETAGICLFLFIYLHLKGIRFFITSLPKGLVRAYFVFFFIFCICQGMAIPRTTFPFVAWTMFSDETRFSNDVKFYRYEATTVHGQKVSLRPEIYFRSLANGRIVTDLDNLVTSVVSYNAVQEKDLFNRRQVFLDDYARKQGGIKSFMSWLRIKTYEENLFTLDEKKEHLNQILTAIAGRYDAWHPQDHLSSIDIIRGAIDISKGTQAQAAYMNVWHLPLVKGEGR